MKKGKSRRTSAKPKSKKAPSARARSQSKSSIGMIPLGDKVIVRPLSEEEAVRELPSGIIIPQTVTDEKLDRGEVVAVGEGRWDEDGVRRIPLGVTVGDKVIFQWGDKIEVNREKYMVVNESNILAILK